MHFMEKPFAQGLVAAETHAEMQELGSGRSFADSEATSASWPKAPTAKNLHCCIVGQDMVAADPRS